MPSSRYAVLIGCNGCANLPALRCSHKKAIIGAARAFLKEAMTELLAALDDDRDRLMRARANLRIACAYAAEGSSSIVQMLTTETGASAIFESSALERAGRDINAAVKHVAMSPQSYIVAGRLHLG